MKQSLIFLAEQIANYIHIGFRIERQAAFSFRFDIYKAWPFNPEKTGISLNIDIILIIVRFQAALLFPFPKRYRWNKGEPEDKQDIDGPIFNPLDYIRCPDIDIKGWRRIIYSLNIWNENQVNNDTLDEEIKHDIETILNHINQLENPEL